MSMNENTKYRFLLAASIVGIVLSGLAGLAEHVKWLESFCAGFSSGCRDTAAFTLFAMPLWAWGIGYFALLTVATVVPRMRNSVLWLVAGGVGVEIVLVGILVSMEWFCIYCIGNFIVMVALAVLAFETTRFWKALSTALLLFVLATYAIPQENKLSLHDTANAGEPDTEVLAKVAGQEIRESEVVIPLSSRILELEQEIYRMKRRRLDELIAEIVLNKESSARGINIQQLITDDVASQGVEITDEELERYYQENRSRVGEWKGTEEELKTRLRASLQQEKTFQKVLEYSKSLGASKYGLSDFLKEPQPALTKISVDGSPSLGAENAPVVVFEFSDYECPSCRNVHETAKKMRELFADRVRWVFKDYPLKRHEHAQMAAEAALCARDQDKFWQYQDLLYASKSPLVQEQLVQFASELGLAKEQFESCLKSGRHKEEIQRGLEAAKKAGIDRTPSFVINGRLFTGAMAFDKFKETIEAELRRVGESVKK